MASSIRNTYSGYDPNGNYHFWLIHKCHKNNDSGARPQQKKESQISPPHAADEIQDTRLERPDLRYQSTTTTSSIPQLGLQIIYYIQATISFIPDWFSSFRQPCVPRSLQSNMLSFLLLLDRLWTILRWILLHAGPISDGFKSIYSSTPPGTYGQNAYTKPHF